MDDGFSAPESYVAFGTFAGFDPMFFSTLPTVADGFQLKTWRGGPERGKPKISPVAKGLLERGLMRLDTGGRLPRLVFTETGIVALRAMMSDRRLADPGKFAHVRQELGIDPAPETEAPHV
jgi:2-hydroxychromene-2-carboxylate isomerase